MRAKEIVMKNFNVAFAVLAAAAALTGNVASAGTLTRAQVVAQLKAAQASGQMAALTGEDSGSAYLSSHFHPTEPRAEVKTELAQAKADGTLGIMDGADSGSAYLSSHYHSTEPRSEVKAELAQAEADGTLNALDGADSGSFYLAAHGGQLPSEGSAVAMGPQAGQ
jgi:Domain of unknown function (DUF4148)